MQVQALPFFFMVLNRRANDHPLCTGPLAVFPLIRYLLPDLGRVSFRQVGGSFDTGKAGLFMHPLDNRIDIITEPAVLSAAAAAFTATPAADTSAAGTAAQALAAAADAATAACAGSASAGARTTVSAFLAGPAVAR